MKNRKGFIRYYFEDGEYHDKYISDEPPESTDDIASDMHQLALWKGYQRELAEYEQALEKDKRRQTAINNANKREPSKIPEAQSEANLLWANNPSMFISDVAKRLSRKGYGSAGYLRKNIKKPT